MTYFLAFAFGTLGAVFGQLLTRVFGALQITIAQTSHLTVHTRNDVTCPVCGAPIPATRLLLQNVEHSLPSERGT